jgi:hypothetical protein
MTFEYSLFKNYYAENLSNRKIFILRLKERENNNGLQHKLYHISEEEGIMLFEPRPSPSYFESIKGDVVFAISYKLLHNYLFPRDCPRVCYYINENTSPFDKEKFFGQTSADFIIAIEAAWFKTIQQTKLYSYELPAADFILLDDCAGYYISYKTVKPLSVQPIPDVFEELFKRNIELRILPDLSKLADEIVLSTSSFSLIRMRNTKRNDTNMNK